MNDPPRSFSAGMVRRALEERGETLDEGVADFFTRWRRTHNDAVFSAYTPEMRAVRKNHLVTGLPDTYGRGRILPDYRRVALYGVDVLVRRKRADLADLGQQARASAGRLSCCDGTFKLRDEIARQVDALTDLAAMARSYGFDVTKPAADARQAIQWTYFAYLAAVKEHDGAAISLGRLDAFFDVYIEQDIKSGALTEAQAQELIDHLVIKLRLVRQLRPKAYDEIFAGDPVWATLCIGGARYTGGGHLVTKTSWRFLRSLVNLGPAPEPNFTVLWDVHALPAGFRRFCAQVSASTCSIQYINDHLMRATYRTDDYGVSCCVSGMKLGAETQFFGARCNLPKLLLYSLNGGVDEITGVRVAPAALDRNLGGPAIFIDVATNAPAPLEYDDVRRRLDGYMDWLVATYVDVNNLIHECHDAYNYEANMMALIDSVPSRRFMAFGVAGLSVLTDSLSAVKHALVTPILDESTGLCVGFDVDGEWPAFGNDDDRADAIAVDIVRNFHAKLCTRRMYRDAIPTLSVLTITSNVMYGANTGCTPDGRERGAPFAPGANPMHERDKKGALCSLNSVAKIPYETCMDGVSNTFSIPAPSLGKTEKDRLNNLCALLDGYFAKGAQHLNVNVMSRETLVEAMNDPERYPNLTVRVSGYAVNFNRLSKAHQREVIARTFHSAV